jgi:glycosyltransferase involved in cell wall biosynthesis
MKVAYVLHRGRPVYGHELAWFAAMPVERVKLITTQAPPAGPVNEKVEYCRVEYREPKGKLFSDATARRVKYYDFERYLDDIDVVVVLEVFSSLSRQFVEYCRKHNKPVAVLVYELIPGHPIYRIPGYRGNTKYVLAHADLFIAVTHAAADHLKKLGAPSDKITVVYPGVDTKLFHPEREGRDNTGLVFIGPRLGLHKGMDLVIGLYRALVTEFPQLRLTVVGQGGLEDEIKALAVEHPGVSLLKPLPNAEIPALLNRNGIFIQPARDTRRFGLRVGAEQFGFSIVEAMACGLAIITSDCGALPEIVTSQNIVCPQGDAAALYHQTRALLSERGRLRELGRSNHELALDRYNLSTQGAALAATLSELESSRQRSEG